MFRLMHHSNMPSGILRHLVADKSRLEDFNTRPDPAEQNHTDSTKDDPHPGSVHSSAPVLGDQPKDTPNLPITPESIRPYAKARMQMVSAKSTR